MQNPAPRSCPSCAGPNVHRFGCLTVRVLVWSLLALGATGPASASGIAILATAGTAVMLPIAGYSTFVEPIQSSGESAVTLNVGTLIFAEPAAETPFPIQVGSPAGLPKNSFVRIRGLPSAVALTEGHSIAAGVWAVPLVGLPTLRLTVPAGVSGNSEITVALVTVDGTTLAEIETAILIADASRIAPDKPEPRTKNVASVGPAGPSLQDSAPTGSTGSSRPNLPVQPPRSEVQQRALRYVAKGDEHLAAGDVSGARLFYQRAFDAELYEGALAMAASYDQVELDKLGVKGLRGDRKIARQWYERARELGAPEAAERMKRLGEQ